MLMKNREKFLLKDPNKLKQEELVRRDSILNPIFSMKDIQDSQKDGDQENDPDLPEHLIKV